MPRSGEWEDLGRLGVGEDSFFGGGLEGVGEGEGEGEGEGRFLFALSIAL